MTSRVETLTAYAHSVNSIDEMLASDEAELQSETWRQDLDETIEQILDRKRSSVAGREQTLTAFNRLATARYVFEELQGKTEQIARALLKSLKAKSSEKEASLALKGMPGLSVQTIDILTLGTFSAGSDYDHRSVG